MNIIIIGSGTSAIVTAKTFLENNYTVYLIDSENIDKKFYYKKKINFLPNIKKSPKFHNKTLQNSIKKFKKKYNIKTKNFLLVSGLISGGLSNFWGAGLEIPSKKYLKQYPNRNLILNEQNYIDKELCIKKNRFDFYNLFFNQKIIKKFLSKKNKSIYFSKLLVAVKQFNKNNLSINNYHNVNLLSNNNKYVYNAKFKIIELLSNQKFNYLSDTFVKNIKKTKNGYKLITDNKKKLNIKINKIIISTGTVGSTILVDKILNLSENYRLFHTPLLKLMYFSFLLPFKIKKIKFGLALLKLNVFIKSEKFSGSFIELSNIKNSFFGISDKNILFSLIKKFFYVGNIFLPPNYSNTFISINKKRTLIYSKNKFDKKKIIFNLKKKINPFLKKLNLFEFFPQNLKFLDNGSDAHYTSTLVNKIVNKKKIINEVCELNSFKNIHVIDGSCIKEGLHYPNYFLMMYARFITKKIIANDKKNKN